MKHHTLLLSQALALAWGLAAAQAVEPLMVFEIPRMDGIVIDGRPDDWGDRGFRINVMANHAGQAKAPKAFDPRARLAWDERGLLILMTVRDDGAHEHDYIRHLFLGDSVEFFVASEVGAHDYYMLVIAPGMDKNYGAARHIFFDERLEGVATAGTELAQESQVTAIEGGYLVEALLPWPNLAIDPVIGRRFGFQLYAMDKNPSSRHDVLAVSWHAGMDTHMNITTSMHTLQLAEEPSTPVDAVVRGEFRDFIVVTAPELAGQVARLVQADRALAEDQLRMVDGRPTAKLQIDPEMARQGTGIIEVYVGDRLVDRVERPSQAGMVGQAVDQGGLSFFQYVFSGSSFPRVDFEHADVVRERIGNYRLRTRFFNARHQEVTEAAEPGRYAAVVAIESPYGRTTRRFFTLYRTADGKQVPYQYVAPWVIRQVEAIAMPDGFVLQPQHEAGQAQVTEAAAVLESARFGRADADHIDQARARRMDHAWWVSMKRHIYGQADETPIMPSIGRLDRPASPVLRSGTPQEAGFDPAVADALHQIGQDWVLRNKGQGFCFLVARGGVVFFHGAYGHIDGVEMTRDMPTRLSSMTKMLSGILVMMYADQGLIDLDEPADRTIPAFRGITVARPMTHRHMHTFWTGLRGHYGDELRDLEERIADEYHSLTIGTRYIYAGVSIALSVKALEAMSGQAFTELYQRLLLDPLELKHTTVNDAHAGGFATAWDIAVIGQMLLNGGAYGPRRLLSPQAIEEGKPQSGTKVMRGVGFHWFDDVTFGHRSANSTTLRVNPRTGLIVAVASSERGKVFGGDLERRLYDVLSSHELPGADDTAR
jgi:CubicO group peptidase (beta-lactamase class C family)